MHSGCICSISKQHRNGRIFRLRTVSSPGYGIIEEPSTLGPMPSGGEQEMRFPFKVADSTCMSNILASPDLTAPSEPQLPQWTSSTSTAQKLASIQAYIEEFQYNYTNKPYVELKKSRGAIPTLNTTYKYTNHL